MEKTKHIPQPRPRLDGDMIGSRLREVETVKLDALCKRYGLNRSEMIRWCVLHCIAEFGRNSK